MNFLNKFNSIRKLKMAIYLKKKLKISQQYFIVNPLLEHICLTRSPFALLYVIKFAGR